MSDLNSINGINIIPGFMNRYNEEVIIKTTISHFQHSAQKINRIHYLIQTIQSSIINFVINNK